MLDYWTRKGLVKVVSLGEKEYDNILFTATSTHDQWQIQGDYFRKKGLWEPAIKCYNKAGSTLLEKEAEAYFCAQKAQLSKLPQEMQELFLNAATAFLLCDSLEHNIKFLTNAAKCLKNAKKHCEAAKLFEKLGQVCLLMHSVYILVYMIHSHEYSVHGVSAAQTGYSIDKYS